MGNIQSDPEEFIRCLLQRSELLKKLFEFEIVISSECQHCHYITRTIEPSLGLNNSIVGKSIPEIIENNKKEDVTTLCEKCQHERPKIKSQTFTSLPEILMVQINRFESQYIGREVRYHKIQQYIEHPQLITVNNISYSLKSI